MLMKELQRAGVKVRPLSRVKSTILGWLGVPVDLMTTDFWQAWFGAESHSGEVVTVDRALQNETVWACVGLIAETIATLPFAVYRRFPNKEPAPEHPLYNLLHSAPSADMAAGTFIEIVVLALLLWGNAFAEIIRVGGRVIALDFVSPDAMSLRRLKDGSLLYSWRDINGRLQERGEADVLHVVGRTLNGITGLSPISYARHVMGGAMAADKAAAKLFAQGLLLQGTFETDLPVKEDKRALFQARLKEYQGAINAGRAPLLEGGVKYKPVSMNPNDAQMLESRGYSTEQICRWFRVPPHMVGHTTNSTSWGAGLEEQKLGFLMFTLQRWLDRIEDECNRKLLSPGDRTRYFTEFNFEGLLRADSAARAAFYSTMTQNGIYTRDDCRIRDNLPPMGGNAAVLTVQSNLVPIDRLGEQNTGGNAQNALKDWLGVTEPKKTLETTA
jgi:HK97 family phage portal protein